MEDDDNIIPLGFYSAGGVAGYLGFPPNAPERKAVSFVFNKFAEDFPEWKYIPSIAKVAIGLHAYEDILGRLEIAEEYADDFLPDKEISPPLMFALICAPFMKRLQESATEENPPENLAAKYKFDQDTVQKATAIWDDAFRLFTGNKTPDKPQEESVFLYHILAFEFVKYARENLEEGKSSRGLLEEDMDDLEYHSELARPGTRIGDDLAKAANETKQRIEAYLYPPGSRSPGPAPV